MKLSEHKELKQEILALPSKEKDKLLLRLVGKDKVLTERLHFVLLESEEDLKQRVSTLKENIVTVMQGLKTLKNLNAKEVLAQLRKLAKQLNHHYKVTKANYEEVELRLFLLNHTELGFKTGLFSSYKNHEQVLANYFVKYVLMTIRKFKALHEDLQYDLRDEMDKILTKIYQGNMATVAKQLELPEQV
ncbi:hypothetical protein VRU48_18990 [Pedobacter sp. KR3-3]|uniref:CHAD domain-containing protein n=1 Tax=Pedobacter albus TaxID=3113905 RepID=A0ABU7ICQ0_9SPHI|nr:hypothetical protein [Pedobacter sp. KR3-3]MEE1947221.1 hypothetical protein [Pedobacter sp. KR3-3]